MNTNNFNGLQRDGDPFEELRRTLEVGDLDAVKRAADFLHRTGRDPVAGLSSIAREVGPESSQGRCALTALADLDSATAHKVAQQLGVSVGAALPERGLSSSVTTPQKRDADSTRNWVIAFVVTLAILWPLYSIYRFQNPIPPKPPEPKPPWTDEYVELEAVTLCQLAAKRRLRDPDSADFPFLSPPSVDVSYSDKVTVNGYMHASNGLGLKVRVDFSCSLQADREARNMSLLDAQLVQR